MRAEARAGRAGVRSREWRWHWELPLGWLVLQAARGVDPAHELLIQADFLVYLLLPTAVMFGLFGAVLGRVEDHLRAANRRLDELSVTDPLTGLYNLRYFDARMAEERARAARSGDPLALAMFDLDHFKAVNDRHGHAFGNDVLVAVAGALRASARRADTVARIGGEEFAVIMPAADVMAACAAAERSRRAVGRCRVPARSGSVVITASAGVAVADQEHPCSERELFARADRALYAAKGAGRNRAVLDRDDLPNPGETGPSPLSRRYGRRHADDRKSRGPAVIGTAPGPAPSEGFQEEPR